MRNVFVSAAMLLAVLAAALPLKGAGKEPGYVWWEGEKPSETNFPEKTWFSASTFENKREDVLSGGDWITNADKRGKDEAFIKYKIKVPKSRTFNLWARKFWKHGPFKWRFGNDRWQTCGKDVALADSTDIRKHLCVNWVYLGKVKLSKGVREFEIRLLAKEGEQGTACFDCFVLTEGPFIPHGKLKPDERSGLADEGFFAYEPSVDNFTKDAMLDLRYLNETQAGVNGFVKRQGSTFRLATGKPVRFWAVNVGPNNIAQNRESIDYMAKRLAKLGVNMVRYHGPIYDKKGDPAKADAKRLDDIFYLVSALKKEGIYTTLSVYFPLWFEGKEEYGFSGYDTIKNKKPFALLYFEPRMQEIHRAWLKQLLTTTNPYTGRTLAREPAAAIVEIINEDSFFFWTFTKKNIPKNYWDKLEQMFSAWLKKRHGSVEKAFEAWGGATERWGDRPGEGRAGLMEAWHMTRKGLKQGGQKKLKRMRDQVRFLTKLQRGFYASTVDHIKKDLGYGGLVSPSNWHVTDNVLLDALERYTYTAGDVIDKHGYFGGKHKGEGSSYSVRSGHTFSSAAAVLAPEKLPLQVHLVDRYPHTITEIGWTNPNRFRSDATFLSAGYGSLQGVDGFYFFALGSNYVMDTGMKKFPVSCPVMAATFPATALLYRRGDVREAKNAVTEVVNVEDLYDLKGSAAAAAPSLDQLRKKDIPGGLKTEEAAGALSPLSFYVGPVVRSFGKTSSFKSIALHRYINMDKKTIRSLTDEMHWNYGKGVVTMNTTLTQGAAGFLGSVEKIELQDIDIECNNEFASIIVTSLDNKPMPLSRKILIQVMTEEQPYGFKIHGSRIADLGGWPFGVKLIDAIVTLRLRGALKPKITALDENGYPTRKTVAIERRPDKSIVIRLSKDVLYYIVEK